MQEYRLPVYNQNAVEKTVKKMEAPLKETAPIEDPRYPRYASIMQDGRLVTDYKSHCANNSGPSKFGNSIRGFLQHNADALIQVSRKRQADRAGAQHYMAATVVPSRTVQSCDQYECGFRNTYEKHSIGLTRSEPVPALFGTFSEPTRYAPSPTIGLTTVFEGGRNTPHGREFSSLGTDSFNRRASKYGASG